MADKCRNCGAELRHKHKTSGGVLRNVFACGRDDGGPPTVPCLERQLAVKNAEIEAAQTELTAWKTAFGTSQLTHALAAMERLRAELAAKDELLYAYEGVRAPKKPV